MLVVMDTDVIVAALRSPSGASAALLRMVRAGDVNLAASVSLFTEYEAVCLRPEHGEATRLSVQQVGTFLDVLASLVKPVVVHFNWRPQLRDPGDEMVLETAINAQVGALLTFNQKHFASAVSRFGLKLALPGPFLRSLQ